jgi:hypothetical protein
MKKEAILLVVVIVLVGVAAFALGSLSSNSSDNESTPLFSLSPGVQGMLTGGSGYYYGFYSDAETGSVLSKDVVVSEIQNYVDRQNNSDLVVARLREFNLVYQAEIIERSTGRHAFDLMVSNGASQISPAAGPNIMWNTKYGPTIAETGGGYGMLGRALAQPAPGDMTLSEAEARDIAASAVEDMADASLLLENDTADTFYGFYEFTLDRDEEPVGALAINGYSGQVWFEDWGAPQLKGRTCLKNQTHHRSDSLKIEMA